MNEAWQIVQQGGPVMIPLMVLSLVLYERCFHLLLLLMRLDRRLAGEVGGGTRDLSRLREMQNDVREMFAQDAGMINSLVAAAPLLGLLGTVMGMVSTFDTMAGLGSTSASEGLAAGISMALITTETGLSIAIPAVVVVYYAERQLQRVVQRLVQLEDEAPTGT